MKRFTYFNSPIKNTTPRADINLIELYNVIKGHSSKKVTDKLREIIKNGNKNNAREFKANNFDYVTVSGTFTTRGDKYLKEISGYMCIDIDHEKSLTKLTISKR